MTQWQRSWTDGPIQWQHSATSRWELEGRETYEVSSNSNQVIGSSTLCSRSGQSSPNFWSRYGREILPTTVATAVYIRRRAKPCSYSLSTQYFSDSDARKDVRTHSGSGFLPGLPLGVLDIPPLLMDPSAVYRKAYAKYLQRQAGIIADLGTFLGESPEMMEQLNSLAPRLENAAKRFFDLMRKSSKIARKAKSKRGLTSALADLGSGAVLEWNLGIAPLLGDAHDIAELLAELYDDYESRPSHKVQASYRDSTEAVWTYPDSQHMFGPWVPYTVGWETSFHVDEIIISKIGSYFEQLLSSDTLSMAGLHPSDAIHTLWNLLTGSWLVDYVVPLGQFFEAVSQPALLGLDSWQVAIHQAEAYTESKYLGRVDDHPLSGGEGTPYHWWADFSHSGEDSRISAKSFTFSRSPWAGELPRYDDFRLPSKPSQIANTASYLYQRYGRETQNMFEPIRNVLTDITLRFPKQGRGPSRLSKVTPDWNRGRTRMPEQATVRTKNDFQLAHINDWRYKQGVARLFGKH